MCPWVLKRWGLVIIGQLTSPDSFLPHYCRAFQCRCTLMSFSNSIKEGAYLNSGHFLLVSLCISIVESSECISPGKGAFPRVCICFTCRGCFALDLNLISLIWNHYRIARVPPPCLMVKEERIFVEFCIAICLRRGGLNCVCPPAILAGIT